MGGIDQRLDDARAPLLRGARVFLRHPTPEDRAAILAIRRVSHAWLTPWEPAPGPDDGAEPGAWFDRILSTADTETSQRHLICDGDAIVGMCSLSQIVRGHFQNSVMGYWRGVEWGGRGLMTEGVCLVLRRSFEHLGLHRVEANIMPRNGPSRSLALRCGFRLEGYSPNYLRIAGRWEGHERYAITREDWEAAASRAATSEITPGWSVGSNPA